MQNVPQTPTSRNPVAFFASFDGQHGQALRNDAGAVWFINDDAPYLLLHGRIDIAQEQRLLDDLHGGLYQLVDSRNSHRPRLAA
jgi:hypothetical protein